MTDTQETAAPPADGATTAFSRPRGAPGAAVFAVLGALLLMPLIYLPQLHQIHSLPKVTVFRLAVVLMLLSWGLRLLTGPRRTLRLRLPDVFLAAFLVWLGFTAALSAFPGASLLGLSPRYEGLLGFAGVGVFYYTASRATVTQLRAVLRALTASGALLGALAVLEMLGPYRPPGFDAFGARAVSTLGNPVFVGAWLTLTIPGTLALLALAPKRLERAAAVCAPAPQAAALYLTAGRGAWLGTAVGLAVALGLAALVTARSGSGRRAWRGRVLWSLGASLAVIALALAITAAARPDLRDSASARVGEAVAGVAQANPGGTAETRLLMWRATAGLVAEKPLLGAGLETFLADFPQVRPLRLVQIEGADAYPDRPHNHWLYLAVSGGVPALLLHLLFLGSVGWCSLRVIFREDAAWQRRLAVCALLGAAAAYEVQGLFSLSLPWIAAGAASVQGLLVSLSGTRAGNRAAPKRRWRPRVSGRPTLTGRRLVADRPAPAAAARVGGALLLVAALPFLTETIRQDWADWDFARAGTQPWDALRLTERAVRLSPRDADYVLGRGAAIERAAAEQGSPALYGAAIALYRDADRRIPSHPDVAFSLARVRTASGDTVGARAEYDALLARDPFHGGALFNVASLSLQTGDPARAIDSLRTLISYAPADAEAWYYLGSAYEAVGDATNAADPYKRALEIVPGYEEAAAGLERVGR
ncbi:MAG: O-antigen ligase family protein [Thermoleophilia bacterium]